MKKIILASTLLTLSTYASDKISIGIGKDFNKNFAYELSYKKHHSFNFLGSDNIYTKISHLYLDNEYLNISSLEPIVLSYDIFDKTSLEFDIGFSYFSKKEIKDKEFGSYFQFKDSISLVYNYSESLDFEANFSHYSNAGIEDANDGINIFAVKLLYTF